MKGEPFGDMKKFPKIFLMRFLDSVTVPKNVKGWDPLRFFDIHCVAKHQKKLKGDPLGKKFQSKKFQKVA